MSYEHIDSGRLRVFKLAQEIERVPKCEIRLAPDQEDRVNRIHEEGILFDFHNNPILLPENIEEFQEYSRRGRFWTAYEGLKHSKITATLNGFGSVSFISSIIGYQFEDVIYDMGMRFSDFEHHQDQVIIARSIRDIYHAKEERKVAMIAMLENAGSIGNVLDRIDVLYGLGMRCMGLTHNDSNYIGSGRTDRGDAGLTHFGIQVVERMNELKILIDIAHASDRTIQDALRISKTPCCSTHDCCQAVSGNPRCKSDAVLKAIADKGGVVGIHAIPNVLSREPDQGIEDVLRNIDHAVDVAGIDSVAVGTDTFFGDHVGMHRKILESVSLGRELPDFPAPYMKGIENPGDFPNVTRGLVKKGYSDDEIHKIIGRNALRVFKEVVG